MKLIIEFKDGSIQSYGNVTNFHLKLTEKIFEFHIYGNDYYSEDEGIFIPITDKRPLYKTKRILLDLDVMYEDLTPFVNESVIIDNEPGKIVMSKKQYHIRLSIWFTISALIIILVPLFADIVRFILAIPVVLVFILIWGSLYCKTTKSITTL